ncbi:hypothetical protein CAPTEDRAFT_209579 [Capitella teleta]|uniref:VWFD domain-containing protein n=1 Tax=Capitella teleta TaxID=283909 RepID=R7VDY6_CAPTE|nr:hypothetical protein CAPTEDRAFT_209579 [Capitella teleta]|eukprot:ELU16839.1 hypothetical protein CAPTEDRAFT_209579 [Capitella teleta]
MVSSSRCDGCSSCIIIVDLSVRGEVAPPNICTCWGDPHCTGFSIPEILIHGSCRHVLASDNCAKTTLSTFKISGSFHKVKPTVQRSYVRTVHVEFKLKDGTPVEATFKQGLDLSFVSENSNDASLQDTNTNIPGFPDVSVVFYKNAFEEFGGKWDDVRVAVIQLPNDIKITWDGVKRVEISMPGSFKGSLCGICGEIDDSNMIIGGHDSTHQNDADGCAPKAASLPVNSRTTDVIEYGNSHYIAGDEDENDECREECGMNQEIIMATDDATTTRIPYQPKTLYREFLIPTVA